MNPPITPGEILLEEYLSPMGISQNAMARAIGVAPRAINEIVLGHRAITPVMSIRFGAFFGQTPEFWHGLQVECDFRALGKKQKKLTGSRQRGHVVTLDCRSRDSGPVCQYSRRASPRISLLSAFSAPHRETSST